MSVANTCIDAFKNLNITLNAISPCCISKTKFATNINFVTDPYLTAVRLTWLQGEFPSECSSCQQAEALGHQSRRQGSNQWYQDNKLYNTDTELIRIDYWTGDLCNLRCVICGPRNSSAWKQELNFPTDYKKVKVNNLWKNLDLTKLKFIHFNGGEPLLSKEHVKFLQTIQDKSQVHLNYNTNATVLPSQELLDLWAEFKLIQLDFSIDDIEERFEYQRYPAKWTDVCDNLRWFVDRCPVNCMFAVNTTVSILNQANIGTLTDWLKTNFQSNRVQDPVEYKQQLAAGLLSTKDVDSRRTQIIKYLDSCDNRRSTDWRKTFPELNQIL